LAVVSKGEGFAKAVGDVGALIDRQECLSYCRNALPRGLGEDLLLLAGAEGTPFARFEGQALKAEAADADADEAEGGETDGGGHAADLAVFTLGEGEFEPGGGDVFADADWGITWGMSGLGVEALGFAGEGAEVFEVDAGTEFSQRFVGDGAVHLGVVGAGMGVAGIEEAIIPAGFVTEQEEAFGIAVEAADGIYVGREAEFGQGAVRGMLLGELGEDVEGLVEGEEHAGTYFSASAASFCTSSARRLS
jgi:hypothetical protein